MFITVSFGETSINFDALYPWNLGTSVYYTYGKYSNGDDYRSISGYLSMDRRWRDRFAISYEDLKITGDNMDYRQYNILGRDFFWIKTGFRIGGIVGFFDSSTLEETWQDSLVADSLWVNQRGVVQDVKYASSEHKSNTHLNGWIAGTQITGDLKWFGYAISYIHSEYFNIEHKSDAYFYEEPFLENWFLYNDTTYYYDNINETYVNQYTGIISRQLGNHLFRAGGMLQYVNDSPMVSAIGTWIWQPLDPLSISTSLMIGESRYSVNPYALLINNNPDVLQDLSNIHITYKLNTNWHLIGVYSFHRYETIVDRKPYHSNFFTIGIQGRF